MTAMTEEEAREKWCPFAVASHTDPRRGFRDEAPTNIDGRPREVQKEFPCIASRCMAWRGAARPCSHCGGDGFNGYHMCARETCPMWSDVENPAALRKDHGYCGLSGGPSR